MHISPPESIHPLHSDPIPNNQLFSTKQLLDVPILFDISSSNIVTTNSSFSINQPFQPKDSLEKSGAKDFPLKECINSLNELPTISIEPQVNTSEDNENIK